MLLHNTVLVLIHIYCSLLAFSIIVGVVERYFVVLVVQLKIALPRLSFVDPQRVCSDCELVAKKELELYDRHLPVLIKGKCVVLCCVVVR